MMKINSTSPVSAVEQYKTVGRNRATLQAEYTPQRDAMEFSSDATLFADTLRNVRTSMTERFERTDSKVETIKLSLENGNYRVESYELANHILMSVESTESGDGND